MSTLVKIASAKYQDFDDCLQSAAADYAEAHGLEGWDLSPRWEDRERDVIVLTVPDRAEPSAPGFRITSQAGADFGVWPGETKREALLAMIEAGGGRYGAPEVGTEDDWFIEPSGWVNT